MIEEEIRSLVHALNALGLGIARLCAILEESNKGGGPQGRVSKAGSDVFDTREAAGYLGVAASTLRKWRTQKLGPAYFKAGGVVRYRGLDLDRYMKTAGGNANGHDNA